MISRPDNWPNWLRNPLPVDWPEDAADADNGCYQHNCVHCRVVFFGHKRRMACKECDTARAVAWAALTPEQQAEETRKSQAEVADWLIEHFNKKR